MLHFIAGATARFLVAGGMIAFVVGLVSIGETRSPAWLLMSGLALVGGGVAIQLLDEIRLRIIQIIKENHEREPDNAK